MRVCLKCEKEFIQNNYAGRVRNICNECHAITQKEYRKKNKERIKEYQIEYRKKSLTNLKLSK
jgi:hypothetical protein